MLLWVESRARITARFFGAQVSPLGAGPWSVAVKVGGDRGLTVRCVGRRGQGFPSVGETLWLPPSGLSPHTLTGRGLLDAMSSPPCLSASSGCCRSAGE